MSSDLLFPGFEVSDVPTAGVTIHCLRKGSGPPLLLLHGYPQTHVIWHKIAGPLSERYTVVVTDLRGYGDSSKPDGGRRHENYSSRSMALDQLEVMRSLGYQRFFLAGHDRGARLAHRMALDQPGALRRLCLMEIVPTLVAYRETNREFATRKMWWFFLIQKEPLPEHVIGADPDFFLNAHLELQSGTPGALTDEAVAEYRRCFRRPETIHATCEDYRAAADIDLVERTGRMASSCQRPGAGQSPRRRALPPGGTAGRSAGGDPALLRRLSHERPRRRCVTSPMLRART